MNKNTRNIVIAGFCIALGLVLPMAFHAIPNAGSVMLPMHIPVLLCGLVTGPVTGLICGIFTPFLSSVITGMPGPAYLPSMICELAVYGLIAGIMTRLVKTGKPGVDVLVSLVAAMLAGRVVYGIINALVFRAGQYSLELWLTASFVTALPGIILQLILIPAVVFALRKAKLI